MGSEMSVTPRKEHFDMHALVIVFLGSQGSRFRLTGPLVGHLRAIMSHLGALILPSWGQVGTKFGHVRP
eukprot:3776798-Karenia_brevis.AAC.1